MKMKKRYFIIASTIVLLASIVLTSCSSEKAKISKHINSELWGLENTGQAINGITGKKNIDINIKPAWRKTMGTRDVIVAILDSGIDTMNDCISDSLYVNRRDPINGVDDDKNGYVDDISGWNFYHDNNQIFIDSLHDYHGTYLASIIAGKHGDDNKIMGVAPNVSIMPLKFLHGTEGDTKDAVEAIRYAYSMGARIMNCSWDGAVPDEELGQVMKEHGNMIFVCSAGKSGNDLEQIPVYPACFDFPNVISVAAVNSSGELIRDSGHGKLADVAAPGENIMCTFPANEDNYSNGTSSATAFVTGVAALMKSEYPELTANDIVTILKKTVKPVDGLDVGSGGIVDATECLNAAKRMLLERGSVSYINLPAWADFPLMAIFALVAVALIVLNVFLSRRKKYKWAAIIPIIATPFFVYFFAMAVRQFAGVILSADEISRRVASGPAQFYFLQALYCGLIIGSTIYYRMKIYKKTKESMLSENDHLE